MDAYFYTALPDDATIETLMEKVSFYRFVQEHGLAIPPTHILGNQADAEAAAGKLYFPCVRKPSA